MNAARCALGAAGAALMGVGGWLLVAPTAPGTPGQVAVWLAGAVVVHDLLLAPLVLLAGLALPVRGRVRGAVRGGLVVAGCLTLVALPPLLRPGRPRNPTSLPLDYPRNLLLVLVVTAAVTAALAAASALRRRRARGDQAGRRSARNERW